MHQISRNSNLSSILKIFEFLKEKINLIFIEFPRKNLQFKVLHVVQLDVGPDGLFVLGDFQIDHRFAFECIVVERLLLERSRTMILSASIQVIRPVTTTHVRVVLQWHCSCRWGIVNLTKMKFKSSLFLEFANDDMNKWKRFSMSELFQHVVKYKLIFIQLITIKALPL